jgi:hypothetical protein
MAKASNHGPDTTSGDYDAMAGYWTMVDTILDGAAAMRAAGGGGNNLNPYLPRFPNEEEEDYQYRRDNAKFTNIYADIVSNLAAKPFTEEVGLDDKADDSFKALAEDIDGRGNNLHVFAANTFFFGINNAVDWILVDYTKARPRVDGQPLSIAEERAQGLRPYWVHVPATRLLAVYTDSVGGEEIFIHARIRETQKQRMGFTEVRVDRIRVLDRQPIYEILDDGATERIIGYAPATYEVFEQQQIGNGRGSTLQWVSIESGPVSIGVIPLVPFVSGRRKEGSWRFVPPMQDAAYLQIEHFQQETALKSIKELTAFPMLAGNGVQPAMMGDKPAPVPVGARSVLYAPPVGENGQHGEWTFIEPSAESLKFLADDVANTEKQLRELGRQPLTAQTGNLTVVTTAFAAQKGNSAIQAWAFNLKDALEQAFVLTAKWLNMAPNVAPEVKVFTDFDLGTDDATDFATLVSMRKSGPNNEPDLSRQTLWEEAKRRGKLSGDFDANEEQNRLDGEMPDPPSAADLAGALTPPGTPPAPAPGDQLAA